MKSSPLRSCRIMSLFLLTVPIVAFCQSALPPPTLPPTQPMAVRYRVTDLGALPDTESVHPYAINEDGEVVGSLQAAGTDHALSGFHWTQVQGIKDVGTLGGVHTITFAINNKGQYVGESSGRPFISVKEGGIKELDDVFGAAVGINEQGQVTGHAVNIHAAEHAFLWSTDTGMQDLGVLAGFTKSWGTGINALGDVAGFLEADGGALRHAFYWHQSALTDLGTLGGKNSEAHGLNDTGQIVGTSYVSDGHFHGFLWQKGRMEDLGAQQHLTLLPGAGGPNSEAQSINNRGQIVGTATDDHGTNIACLWENGQIYDLNSLIPADSNWHLVLAEHINAQGQIVGFGNCHTEGKYENHGFLLTPLSPPSPDTSTPSLPSKSIGVTNG